MRVQGFLMWLIILGRGHVCAENCTRCIHVCETSVAEGSCEKTSFAGTFCKNFPSFWPAWRHCANAPTTLGTRILPQVKTVTYHIKQSLHRVRKRINFTLWEEWSGVFESIASLAKDSACVRCAMLDCKLLRATDNRVWHIELLSRFVSVHW